MQQASGAQRSRERPSHAEPQAGRREHLHRPEGGRPPPMMTPAATSFRPASRTDGPRRAPSPMDTPEATETPGPTSQPEPDHGEARQLSRPKERVLAAPRPKRGEPFRHAWKPEAQRYRHAQGVAHQPATQRRRDQSRRTRKNRTWRTRRRRGASGRHSRMGTATPGDVAA